MNPFPLAEGFAAGVARTALHPPVVNTPTDNASAGDRENLLNEQIEGLLSCCPWTRTNPKECPLRHVRALPSPEATLWFEGLTVEEKEYLLQYHRCCLAVRCEREEARKRTRRRAKKSARKRKQGAADREARFND